MILADSSVWIDHLRAGNQGLAALLEQGSILTHPFVIGEIALGNLRQRDAILTALHGLPRAVTADDREVLRFIARHDLAGCGIGYIDAHLLAATRLTHSATLWTRDKRLHAVATAQGIAAEPVRSA